MKCLSAYSAPELQSRRESEPSTLHQFAPLIALVVAFALLCFAASAFASPPGQERKPPEPVTEHSDLWHIDFLLKLTRAIIAPFTQGDHDETSWIQYPGGTVERRR